MNYVTLNPISYWFKDNQCKTVFGMKCENGLINIFSNPFIGGSRVDLLLDCNHLICTREDIGDISYNILIRSATRLADKYSCNNFIPLVLQRELSVYFVVIIDIDSNCIYSSLYNFNGTILFKKERVYV